MPQVGTRFGTLMYTQCWLWEFNNSEMFMLHETMLQLAVLHQVCEVSVVLVYAGFIYNVGVCYAK